ncbi:aspartyl protease family protein [uncultured Brachyspira sp.]|uniref:retroviral-like aspartic protease family protein n=1 Tax=uncultured Brachyspira sp. TaxID=221953 RepID=UPI0025F3D1FA|nr:aspartyl protease family protein [uncultured Brachyspira sp.]
MMKTLIGDSIHVSIFNKKKKYHFAFRLEYNHIPAELKTKVLIKNKFGLENEYDAVWDTGATNTAITHKVYEELKLKPIDSYKVRGVNSGIHTVDIVLIDVLLLNKVNIKNIRAGVCDIGGCDILIGMDIIKFGDLAISNRNNKTIFSFAMPPFDNPTDLLEKANKVNKSNGYS